MMDEQTKKAISDLQSQLDSLKNNATIPFEIGEAFKARVLSDAGIVVLSNKSGSSESQGVNESGSSSYSVLGEPDGFLEVTIAGTIRYIPYYA